MSRKGCPPDNAACEGFFGRVKNEVFYGRTWTDISTDNFIDNLNKYLTWYNETRIKLSLGTKSQLQYRRDLGTAI
jgi:transposase InsO family protein